MNSFKGAMTKEIRFIIENHKFKSEWTERFTFMFAVACLTLVTIIGLSYSISIETWPERIAGLLIPLMTTFGIINLIRRFPNLNKFTVVNTGKNQVDNYQFATKLVKEIDPIETEHDIHNFCISVKVFSYPDFIPKTLRRSGFPSWITIISLDNKLLINERPEILRLALWSNYSLERFLKLIDKDAPAREFSK